MEHAFIVENADRRLISGRSQDFSSKLVPLSGYHGVMDRLVSLLEDVEFNPNNIDGKMYHDIFGDPHNLSAALNALQEISNLLDQPGKITEDKEGILSVHENFLYSKLSSRELKKYVDSCYARYQPGFRGLRFSYYNLFISARVIETTTNRSAEALRSSEKEGSEACGKAYSEYDGKAYSESDGKAYHIFSFPPIVKNVVEFLGFFCPHDHFVEFCMNRRNPSRVAGQKQVSFRHVAHPYNSSEWERNFRNYRLNKRTDLLCNMQSVPEREHVSFQEATEVMEMFPDLRGFIIKKNETLRTLWMKRWYPWSTFKDSVTRGQYGVTCPEQIEDMPYSVSRYFIENPSFLAKIFELERAHNYNGIFELLEGLGELAYKNNNYYLGMLMEEGKFVRNCLPYIASYQSFRGSRAKNPPSHSNKLPVRAFEEMKRILNHPLYHLMMYNLKDCFKDCLLPVSG